MAGKGTGNPATDAELADLALALAHNPKTRKKFAGAVKEAGLPYTFNDVEAETAVAATVESTVDEKLAKAGRESAARETAARLNTQRAKLVKSDGNPAGRFTEEVVKTKLEPFMQERGITDYEDAAILFAAHNPEMNPKPEIATKGIWELPTGDWLKDPKGTARRMAHEAVRDLVAQRA
jgi:hypothetical protein